MGCHDSLARPFACERAGLAKWSKQLETYLILKDRDNLNSSLSGTNLVTQLKK